MADIQSPLISVIVVNWNRRELLRSCLTSLTLQQGVPHEIILVDNGSTDGSVEMARLVVPDLRVIRNATNQGFCRANNQGIAEAIRSRNSVDNLVA